jgi:hypothetical protein
MESEQQRPDSLNAAFANDPAAFLRRFVKAFTSDADRKSPSIWLS